MLKVLFGFYLDSFYILILCVIIGVVLFIRYIKKDTQEPKLEADIETQTVNSHSIFTNEEKGAISLIVMGALSLDDGSANSVKIYLHRLENILDYPTTEIENSINNITTDKALFVVSKMDDIKKATLSMILVEAAKTENKVTREKEAFMNYIEGKCYLLAATRRAIDNGFVWNM